MGQLTKVEISGNSRPEFEPVRKAFAENFALRGELGGAVAVVEDGEVVVDLWGGIRDEVLGAPWTEDTMVMVFSATKGMAGLALALAHARGWLDYDALVARYWPEFADQGKGGITVRQLLAHQAGLHAFHERVGRREIAEPARLAEIMARARPAWPPGARNAYHALTLGFYESEVLRRVDPQRRSIGQFFQDEIAGPLGVDFHICLPDDIPNSRLAILDIPGLVRSMLGLPLGLRLALMTPWSHAFRAMMVNPGTSVSFDVTRIYARELEVPSAGGVGTARAIARAYGAFADGGKELGIGKKTLAALQAPAVPPAKGAFDRVLHVEAQYALGFMKPSAGFPFGHDGAFGAPGAGGSMGYGDPAKGIGYGYVTNRLGTGLDADPRDVALRKALAEVTG